MRVIQPSLEFSNGGYFFKNIKIMINSRTAYEMCQKVHRDAWANEMSNRLSEAIKTAAQKGEFGISFHLTGLIVGAENLSEYAELVVILKNVLDEAGYSHVVNPDGSISVSWK